MIPYSHQVSCGGCQAQLTLTAIRDNEPRTKTIFMLSCPACQGEVKGEIPLSVSAASLQVAFYQRARRRIRAGDDSTSDHTERR